jgi:uncharacterized sulfatase
MGRQKNILLITSDEQRKDSLGLYQPAGPTCTPHLDALAADGVVFDRAYTPHATCTPARASILTGQYASRHGAYTIGTALDWNCLKVSDLLADAGYETYAVGKMHFRPVSTPGEFESAPLVEDLDFWREKGEPYYGFRHCRLLNRHTNQALAWGMHYGVWLRDRHGLGPADFKKYFNGADLYGGGSGRWDLPRDCHQSVFVAEQTLAALERHGPDTRPFFIWASFTDPHNPLAAPPPYDTLFDPQRVDYRPYRDGEFRDKPTCYQQLYDAESPRQLPFSDRLGIPGAYSVKRFPESLVRRGIAVHHGMVTLLDEEVGRIIAALKARGLYDDTLILYTTDHGDTLGNHGFVGKGFPAYEEVYNIPLIVKPAAGQGRRAVRSAALCGLTDLVPTVLDVNGLDVPEAMQGRSLGDELRGVAGSGRPGYIIENRLVETGFCQRMLVTERYKLVVYQDAPLHELYDLAADRDQYVNLWRSAAHRVQRTHMLREMIRFYDADDSGAGDEESLLRRIAEKMRAEGPLQPRTSFS